MSRTPVRAARALLLCALSLPLTMLAVSPAQAQAYPNKPIRVLLGYSAGTGIDVLSRAFLQRMGDVLGQQIVVDNRAGASSTIAADALAKSAPDGYTLHITETGYLVFHQISGSGPDPIKSFLPVAPVMDLPLLIAVPADFPARTVQEFIAELKANPNKHSFGTPGVGLMHHLGFEQFKSLAGVQAVHVPYKGGTPAIIPDLITGRITIGMLSTSVGASQERNGKLRVIATMTAKRVPNAPNWPALGETYSGFEATPVIYLVAPAGTPADIVQRINAASREALARPEVAEAFAKGGALPTPGSAEDMRKRMIDEHRRWGDFVRRLGIKEAG